jgi:hypothetical protein
VTFAVILLTAVAMLVTLGQLLVRWVARGKEYSLPGGMSEGMLGVVGTQRILRMLSRSATAYSASGAVHTGAFSPKISYLSLTPAFSRRGPVRALNKFGLPQ